MKFAKYTLMLSLFFLAIPVQAQMSEQAQSLANQVATLAAEVQMLEDENEIENLQKIFGFYIDKRLWSDAAQLFANDGTIEISGEGVYVGKERILAYLQSKGEEGPAEGILNDHMQLQPVIHVYSDGTAKGRWHHFSQEAVHGESEYWGAGIYENDYVKDQGVWKIKSLHLYSTMRTPYAEGWSKTALPKTIASEILPPDYESTVEYENYPAVYIVPFHYENPVSGTKQNPIVANQTINSVEALTESLSSLDKRLSLLKDADDVERLHVIYGYYLARNQWDHLTGIFADDGTIEIAQRGIYVGQASVRRNLDLYGVQGELPGTLHNHMQYQPVIHVAEDGQSANMRSRAFSMMGSYQGLGMWMGGVYENVFVKQDGVWKIGLDQVFNTYFTPYNQGWISGERRSAPGISENNPPDEAPSTFFEMYPSPHLPAFHYANPVLEQ